jgi:hypothetical protein
MAGCFAMPKPPQDLEENCPLLPPTEIEHEAPRRRRIFTAWHHYLAHALHKTRVPGFDVHCFVKLGELPIEADSILLHLDKGADIQEFRQYFSFLVPSLRRYLLLEYKSPDDRLTIDDFDTVRAYALLCKRKYRIRRDVDVAVAMLYSHTDADFFAGCADSGYPFVETEPGVRASLGLPLHFYAVDLVAWGKLHPDHPINLLSARRREYGKSGLKGSLGPFSVVYGEVFHRELKKMNQLHVPGAKELSEDLDETVDLVMAYAGVERRLRGLSPEDRLRGLTTEERARLRELLKQEER